MDSTNNFLTAFKLWLAAVDEGYLVGIANRGLYNRAQKDLGDNPTVQIEYGDKFVNCTLPDGTVCSLSNELQKLTCSCPARGVCKHILMSILYLKQNSPSPGSAGNEAEAGTISETVSDTESEANIGESQAGAKADYSMLLNLSPGELRKLCGDKAYDECMLRLEFGIRARVEEGSLLTVRFEAENISVRFPPQNPLDYSICSCKATGFCRHRAEAIIQFQLARGVTTQADLARGRSIEIPQDTLSAVKQLLEEILELGLSRLPNTVVENLEQAAVMCHSADVPNLEKQLRAIKGEMEQYLDKNVSFSSTRVRKRISILYGTVLALENGTAGPELAGEHKSVYFDIPPIEIWGLGAEGWSTKSGYEGITFYFLDPGLQRWFTYTNSRPTYYEDSKASFVKMYKGSPPWAMEGSCEEFSKSKIHLVDGKINAQGRFSASEQSRGAAKGLTQLAELDLSKVGFADWSLLLDRLAPGLTFTLADSEENFNLVLLHPNRWGKGTFEPVSQTFSLPIYDAAGKQLEIVVQFSEATKTLIDNLENFARNGCYPEMLLGRVYTRAGTLVVYPITACFSDGGLVNLTLEAE